eukprot:UN29170
MKSSRSLREKYLVVMPAALIAYFCLRLFCPIIFQKWPSRRCMLNNIWQCLIAPFGRVRFRDFYTGDV